MLYLEYEKPQLEDLSVHATTGATCNPNGSGANPGCIAGTSAVGDDAFDCGAGTGITCGVGTGI